MELLKNLLFASLLLMLIASCGGRVKEKEISKIIDIEKKYFADKNVIPNKEKTIALINTYKEFIEQFPNDTASAAYLFKAAQLSISIMIPKQSIEFYDNIIKKIPNYNKASDCLFLKGFIFETQLYDIIKARQCYEEFIKKYPKHVLADDAKISINNLGKSPEELIKEFEAKANLSKLNENK